MFTEAFRSLFNSPFSRVALLGSGMAVGAGCDNFATSSPAPLPQVVNTLSPASPLRNGTEDWRAYSKVIADVLPKSQALGGSPALHSKAAHTALVFVNSNCPLAARSVEKLNELQSEFGEKIQLNTIAVFSKPDESEEKVEQFARTYGAHFPLIIDPNHILADALHAERSPEVFLLDSEYKLIYRGAIDDKSQVRGSMPSARNDYLREVLNAIRDDKPIEESVTEPQGCFIDRPTLPAIYPTFNDDIGPLIEKHCTYCHRPGDVGSKIPLTHFDEIAGSSTTLAERIGERYMPPWRPDPRYGEFSNDSRLDVNEIWAFRKWAEKNAPVGNSAEPYQIKTSSTVTESRLSNPDEIVYMTPVSKNENEMYYVVPKSGVLPYEHFRVQTDFGEDKWLVASEVRAMSPEVVHHINVFIVPPVNSAVLENPLVNRMAKAYAMRELGVDPKEFDEVFRLYGPGMKRQLFLIGNYTPSHTALRFSEEHGVLIPRGSEIVFECHYTPNDRCEVKSREAVALKFASAVPDNAYGKQVITRSGAPSLRELKIQPNSTLTLTKTLEYFADAELLSLRPHMHLRGHDFRAYIEEPGKAPRLIMYIPEWDYQLQIVYNYEKPEPLPKGSKLHMTYSWNNTASNPLNEHPEAEVRFGTKIMNEMGMAWPTYAYKNPAEAFEAEQKLEASLSGKKEDK